MTRRWYWRTFSVRVPWPMHRVTLQLMNPRGWIYVDRHGFFRWGWEARLGGFGLDAGIERTKRRALAAARRAVAEEVQTWPEED